MEMIGVSMTPLLARTRRSCVRRAAGEVRTRRRSNGAGAFAMAVALLFATMRPSAAESDAASFPVYLNSYCETLPDAFGLVDRHLANGKIRKSVFTDAPAALLLRQINSVSGSASRGSGVLAVELVGSRQVIVGIITLDRSRICDWYLLTVEGWEAIRAAALGRVAIYVKNRRGPHGEGGVIVSPTPTTIG
jgi:hypothetical protein